MSGMNQTLKTNFRYPDLKPTDFRFGGNTKIIREDGDWREYVPTAEEQLKHGVESSACFVEAQQNTIATIQEEEFNIPNLNYSSRFNSLFTDSDEYGGSPVAAAQSFRHQGLIPESMLPFSKEIKSWQEFKSFKGGNESACVVAGKQFLKYWKLNWFVVFERYESKEIKIAKLRSALKESPVPMSVPGWFEKDGIYYRPQGMMDNHLTECVYVDDEGFIYVWDSYSPFLKKLDKDINPEFAMKWTVTRLKKEKIDMNIFLMAIGMLRQLGIRLGLNKNV